MIGELVRGGVYWARVPGAGDRPVVVLSWDALNSAIRSPIVCEVTTTRRQRAFPTSVPLPAGAGDFRSEIGHLSDDRMAEIERALLVALDLGGALPAARP